MDEWKRQPKLEDAIVRALFTQWVRDVVPLADLPAPKDLDYVAGWKSDVEHFEAGRDILDQRLRALEQAKAALRGK